MHIFVMKYVITHLLYLHSFSHVLVLADTFTWPNQGVKFENRFIEFPDDDGVVQKFDLETNRTQNLELIIGNISHSSNHYYLYTRQSPWLFETLKMNNVQSIRNSNFNACHPTVVIVHGWTGNFNSGVNNAVRKALLAKGNYNIIVLDWSFIARKDYVTAVAGVPRVGQRLGQFLAFLCSVTGANLSNIHLVGHSLGAHVVGNAGRELGGRVARITGLDPAGPMWNFNINRLKRSDGIYVEVLHTNSGTYGIMYSNATADFYANGGKSQPGCTTNTCCHNRSWKIFAATITFNHLVGHKCSTFLQLMLDDCLGDTVKLGNEELIKQGYGVYRVNTKSEYPY